MQWTNELDHAAPFAKARTEDETTEQEGDFTVVQKFSSIRDALMRGHRSRADPSENKRRRVDVDDAARVGNDEWVAVVNALIDQDVEEEASGSASVSISSSSGAQAKMREDQGSNDAIEADGLESEVVQDELEGGKLADEDAWECGMVRVVRGLCRIESGQADRQVRGEVKSGQRLWWSMGAAP